jgi:hypothetical protein
MTADRVWDDGMSLRDYFAANAMPEFISAIYAAVEAGALTLEDDNEVINAAATKAYAMADAMLMARDVRTSPSKP